MRKSIITVLLFALAAVSCQRDLDHIYPKESGDEVKFGVAAQPTTKTIYADEDAIADNGDAWDLLWVEGDKVKVFCEQGLITEGSYRVLASQKALERTGDAGIQWGDTSVPHDFYAIYPDDETKLISYSKESHIATMALNNYQIVTVSQKSGLNYTTTCDMKNQYMVAKRTGVDPLTTESVGLTFDPIMSTLKVTVQGPNNSTPVFVTGVSVIVKVPVTIAGNFRYDIVNKRIIETTTIDENLDVDDIDENSTALVEESFFINIDDANNLSGSHTDGVYGIQLKSGETITMDVFFPPVLINEANKFKIRVHTTGSYGAKTVTYNGVPEIAPSAKKLVTLPQLPTSVTGNNWITPLDDNVYVSQMSIPGTHDAGTGEGMSWGIIGKDLGQTQSKTLSEQLNMGIRAFDLRPAVYKATVFSSANLYIYHGVVRTLVTFNTALSYFTNYLDNNPGEFIIITMRHESEAADIGQSQTNWSSLMVSAFNNISSYLVPFNPALTIGDCRGKILVLSRDSYADTPVGGYITGWGFTESGTVGAITGPDGSRATLWVQDYYDCTANTVTRDDGVIGSPAKVAAIESMIDRSAANTDYTVWRVNHTSGYSSTTELAGFTIPSMNGYRYNAAYCNPTIYEYLNDNWTPGPLGIVLMDFVGERTDSNIEVYGDLLPQQIVDINYKYHMRRKNE